VHIKIKAAAGEKGRKREGKKREGGEKENMHA
jgi:hypothetical protein